jgi:hypothetical protein
MKRSPKRRAASIERQIKALRTRVGALEAVLRRAKPDSESEARRKALAEYYKQEEIQLYLRNPGFLKAAIESETERNAFLKSRGFKPEPSRIPEQFRRGLRAYQPKAPRTEDVRGTNVERS